jgi:hypothetical protein
MTMGVRRREDGKDDEIPLWENLGGRRVVSKPVSHGDVVRGFGDGDLLGLLATKCSFVILYLLIPRSVPRGGYLYLVLQGDCLRHRNMRQVLH